MGKAIVAGGARASEPSNYDPVFSNNTWEQIIDACQKNKVPDTWVVGSQKAMTINGTEYPIDIIGKNHDTYSDGSGTAPLTFQMHDCYAIDSVMHVMATNSVGWTACSMRTTNLPQILALMPPEVQSGIKEVNKMTSAGNKSTTINTTADTLFLLSEIEVFGVCSVSVNGEGSQYAYYAAGNSKVKKTAGTADHWWCRSPYASSTSYFSGVLNNGTLYGNSAKSREGVAFAFCF